MFAIIRMLLNGSACPRKATTACEPNCIFGENLCQGVRELVASAGKSVLVMIYLRLGMRLQLHSSSAGATPDGAPTSVICID
jgi:hypothetical protein